MRKGTNRLMTGRLASAVLLAALTIPWAAAEKPSGWVLNAEKSALAGPGDEVHATLRPKAVQTGLLLASTGVAPSGRERALILNGDELSFDSEVRFRARLDGRDYPIHGLPIGDTIAIDLDEGDTVTSTIKAQGEPVARFRRTVSADERTMIVTARYYGTDGRISREKLVFERR